MDLLTMVLDQLSDKQIHNNIHGEQINMLYGNFANVNYDINIFSVQESKTKKNYNF